MVTVLRQYVAVNVAMSKFSHVSIPINIIVDINVAISTERLFDSWVAYVQSKKTLRYSPRLCLVRYSIVFQRL